MSYLKQYGTSAKGNDRLLKSYGGNAGSSPMARQKYASGGAVKAKEGNPSLSEGLSAADGAPAKPSLARPGRKMAKGKDAGKKGTTVNIVIAGKGPDAGPKPDMPMPPPGAGPGGPPMPPPPMRANGGAVGKFAKGGRIANLGKFAHGGKVKSHISKSDEAEDKDVRGDDHEFAKGGKVGDGGDFHGLRNNDGGAMGGKARLAKIKMYGK